MHCRAAWSLHARCAGDTVQYQLPPAHCQAAWWDTAAAVYCKQLGGCTRGAQVMQRLQCVCCVLQDAASTCWEHHVAEHRTADVWQGSCAARAETVPPGEVPAECQAGLQKP